jgi:hypothetical protein
MKSIVVAALILFATPHASGQDAGQSDPASPFARAALARYDREVRQAELAYIRAVQQARNQLRRELEQAKLRAMRAGNLDDANLIQIRLDELTPAGPDAVSIQAGDGWQVVGEVTADRAVVITARGEWTNGIENDGRPNGPDGLEDQPKHGFPDQALIGRIGAGGEMFLVGSRLRLIPSESGTLYMMMNRSNLRARADRMQGEMQVELSAQRSSVVPPAVPDESVGPEDVESGDALRDEEGESLAD